MPVRLNGEIVWNSSKAAKTQKAALEDEIQIEQAPLEQTTPPSTQEDNAVL
ncbi:MAG: hypothetical protein FWF63_00455 [Fibromonadales bacterium]|nr:hypothetical protein [Fibromonadales bacterium]